MNRNHTLKSLGYLLATICVCVLACLLIFAALKVTLPEEHVQYEVVLTVFAFIGLLFFTLSALPCLVMSAVHSVFAMVKDRKFLFPIILFTLDLAALASWVLLVRRVILVN